jgi:hypothetical protein
VYICFANAFCQPFRRLIKRKKSVFFVVFHRLPIAPALVRGRRWAWRVSWRVSGRREPHSDDHPQIKALPAPHCGHIPQPFFGK